MSRSIVGFQRPGADLHHLSPRIFAGCLVVVFLATALLITYHFTIPAAPPVETLPAVIMQLQNIPEIQHRATTAAPAFPASLQGAPVPVDFMPDEITIETTKLDRPAVSVPGPVTVPGVAASPIKEDPGVYDASQVDTAPTRVAPVTPIYPPLAERAGIEGSVTLRVLVTTEGVVDSVIVVSGPTVFREAAVTAAEATKFTPAQRNGRAVHCWVQMPFRFRLSD